MAYRSLNRARRPRGNDSGAHWISYSDMMASLLLVFVLAVSYSIYQYYNMLELKTMQLNEQQVELDKAQVTLVKREEELETANATLMGKQEELAQIQIQLDEKEQDLNAAQVSLGQARTELEKRQQAQVILQTTLDEQATRLGAMQAVLDNQQERIDDLIGVRSKIIRALSGALNEANLRANVDTTTGDIRLESQVFFDTNSFNIKASGQELLTRFLPVYLSVLMQEEYAGYVGEIIIEGHTDTAGSYITNLKLSQNRALAVAEYCLQMNSLSAEMKEKLQQILTAKGRSYSDPIYNADGSVNMDSSRRVEFKFRLKDAEMIQEMDSILSGARE